MSRKETVRKKIEEAFGDAVMSVNVSVMGTLVDIDMTYHDSIPTSSMRRWIDDNIEEVNNITLDRIYSQHVIDDTLRELYEVDMDLQLMVISVLAAKDFGNGPTQKSKQER